MFLYTILRFFSKKQNLFNLYSNKLIVIMVYKLIFIKENFVCKFATKLFPKIFFKTIFLF